MSDFASLPERDAPAAAPRPAQFSLGQLLLWMTAASAVLAAIYWMGGFAVALTGIGLIGYLPYRFGACRLWESSLIAIGFGGTIVAALMPTCVIPREVARRSTCSNHLKNIGLALHNYHDTHGVFPPAYIADENGRPMHSWRVLILPFLEQEKLYKQYRFNEPWDGPNNSKLHSQIVSIYRCPSAPTPADGTTSYVAVVGPRTMWPGDESSSLRDVRDDQDSTLLIVEVHNSGIHWMEPRDLHVTQMATTVNPQHGQGISSPHEECAHVLTTWATSRRLPNDLPSEHLEALLTRDGGEAVELP